MNTPSATSPLATVLLTVWPKREVRPHLELTSVPANRGSASDRRILHRTSVTTVRNVVRAWERGSKRNLRCDGDGGLVASSRA
jgi:hypothetical protein